MLLSGINHVAVLTGDTERFLEFYTGVFEATHEVLQDRDGFKLTLVRVGPTAELDVFEVASNTEHERQVPMFGRGRLDHLALEAMSLESFYTTLLARQLPNGWPAHGSKPEPAAATADAGLRMP